MTSWARLLAFLALAVVVLGLATRSGAAVALSIPLLVFLGGQTLHRPPRIAIDLTRETDVTRAPAGSTVTVTVRVVNRGGRLRELYVEDGVPAGLSVTEGAPAHIGHLAPGEEMVWRYRVRGPRGEYRWKVATVSAAAGWGGRGPVEPRSVDTTLLMLPSTQRLSRVAIAPRQTRGFIGPIAGRRAGSGVSFWGIREYQPGDPLERINARLSARHPESILVGVHEQDRIADVTVLLDARTASYRVAPARFESSVTAAASLSDTFLADGNRVALMDWGEGLGWVPPGYGRVQRERIRERLGRTRLGSTFAYEHLEQIPRLLLPARSQVVLVSPFETRDLAGLERLRSLGYALLLVVPLAPRVQPLDARADPLAVRLARVEEELLYARVRRTGTTLVRWDTGTPLARAVRRVLAARIAS